jgi:sortase A
MRYVRIAGKLLISLGFGVLMFVAWTLWGTGIYTSQQQNALEQEFADAPPVVLDTGDEVKVPATFQPGPGEHAFQMRIPTLDLEQIVVEGVGTDALKKGPGHYPECRRGFDKPLCTSFEEVWPGEDGRVIVSGHRTTYGAPFFNIDKLKRGDLIVTETRWGEFTYEVTIKTIVEPESPLVVIDTREDDNREPELVLTTCNPRFSAAQRLIVYAELVT